jgi:hypothetical protein
VFLGACLAGFYLVPTIYEQRSINIGEVLSQGVRPVDNFLFTPSNDADHNHFNLLVSAVALSEIAALALVIILSYCKPSPVDGSKKNLWMPLALWGVMAGFLMLSASNIFWEHLPKLRFVQLPFRWLLCLNFPLAFLLAVATARSATTRWIGRVSLGAALLATLLMTAHRTQMPWWETADDIQDLRQSIMNGRGYEGVDEYVPAGADPYELNKDLPRLSDEAGTAISAAMIEWGANEKHFRVMTAESRNLRLRLFNYPAWRATVNGQIVQTETADVTGQMIVPITSGENDVVIKFVRTRDRTLGDLISLLGVAVFAAAWMKTRPQAVVERNP